MLEKTDPQNKNFPGGGLAIVEFQEIGVYYCPLLPTARVILQFRLVSWNARGSIPTSP
jgi:hypothetical protein